MGNRARDASPMSPASADPRIGSELAGYRLEELVGRGGMSVVYRACDERLRRNVALKLLSPDLADDEHFRRRFLRESRIASSLHHPNVVPVYGAGETDGLLYLAMRYVDGSDLKALIRRDGPLDPGRAIALLRQVASALDAAHAKGLVHRDVKPGNVLIEGEGADERAYLADFGLTKTETSHADASVAGQLVGTIDYVAPEQIRGRPLNGRADVYSLGCVLYECLTGARPFERGSDVAVIYAHLQDDPPHASGRRAGLPDELDAVLVRALSKDPVDRYASARELVVAADAALEGVTMPRPARGRRRRLAVGAAAGLATAALLSAALVLLLTHKDASTAAPSRPPYRATLAMRFSEGAPASRPLVGMLAIFDDGSKQVGLAGLPPPTARVVLRLDRRLTEPEPGFLGGSTDVFGARRGALVGYFTSQPGGGSAVQQPIRKLGVSVEGSSGRRVAELGIDVPPEYAPVLGRVLPLTARLESRWLVITIDLRRLLAAFRSQASDVAFGYVGIYLFGRPAAHVASAAGRPTRYLASVTATPCLDLACERLGKPVTGERLFTLPGRATVRAPARAVYGRKATFRGTGRPGDLVSIAFRRAPGSAPPCTPSTVELPQMCAPRLADAWDTASESRTRIRSNGSWSLAVPLRSVFEPALPQGVHPASGRYAAAAHSDPRLFGIYDGGGQSVFVEASRPTRVVLDRPRVTLARTGRRLSVAIRIPGADSHVAYVARFAGQEVARGRLSVFGTATTSVEAPRRRGVLEVRASVWGAEPSRVSIAIDPDEAAGGPVVTIHGMRLTRGFGSERDIYEFCNPYREGTGAVRRSCTVPPVLALGIGYGIFEATKAKLAAAWRPWDWELYLDGERIDLAAFGTIPDRELTLPNGDVVWLRQWNVVVDRLTAGTHTVRSLALGAETTWTIRVPAP
jgi:Protein kinase domain